MIFLRNYFHLVHLFFICCLVAVSLPSCEYSKTVYVLSKGKTKHKDFKASLPFEYYKGLILVKAFVNEDSQARSFIFDTGAFDGKIAAGWADSLKLEKQAYKQNSDSHGNTRKIAMLSVEDLQLGGKAHFQEIAMGKVEYDSLSATPCITNAGLLGGNLLRLAHWKIDYANKTLTVSDKPLELPKTKPDLALAFSRELLSAQPYISLKINDKEVKNICFDTGFNGGLLLPTSVMTALGAEVQDTLFDFSSSGIYGKSVDTLYLAELQIEGFPKPVQATFSAKGKALIGNELISFFTVFIDPKKEEIKLFLRESIDFSQVRETSFIPGVLNDTAWVVTRCKSNSGFALGDTLRRINGQQPKGLFNNYCEYYHRVGNLLRKDTILVEDTRGQVHQVVQ